MPAQGTTMSTRTQEHVEVTVIGGGAIGLSIAWRAARTGLRCRLLERDSLGHGTSRVAAGMLAPVGEADPGESAGLALGLDSAARWPGYAAELAREGGDPGLQRCGALRVARDGDEAEALEREHALRRDLGLGVTRLRPSEARRREPALAPDIRLALDLPDDHAVDPRALCLALGRAARAAGVEIREDSAVEALLGSDDQLTGVRVASGVQLGSDQVVIAAGAWSAGGWVPEALRPPVRPVKGQALRLRDPSGAGLVSRVLRLERSYLVPRGDGRYVLGATMEERGFDTAVTAGGVWELLDDAAGVVPGLLELELEEVSAGLRPGTPDNGPLIGARAGDPGGLLWATGHHRNGILLAPVTAEAIVALLTGRQPPVSAEKFSPDRFAPAGNDRLPGALEAAA